MFESDIEEGLGGLECCFIMMIPRFSVFDDECCNFKSLSICIYNI